MRRWSLFILLFILMPLVSPARAIPAEFTAWLYTPDTGLMTLVDLSGQVDEFALPVAPPYTILPYTNVVVSPNGNTIAYVLGQPSSTNQQLMVYDYPSRSIIAQYPVIDAAYTSIDFGGRFAFSPDGTRLAFGYSLNPASWELIVIDLTTFSIAGSITSSDSFFDPSVGMFAVTPTPTYFISSDKLAFTLILGGSDGAEPDKGFVWNIATNDIVSSTGYAAASDIFRPTGDAIMAVSDSRFGAAPEIFPMYQANTIQVYDAAAGARWPIYTNPMWSIGSTSFVFNGRQIAFVAYDGMSNRAYIMNRDGTLTGSLPVGVEPYEIVGAPDGFIYTKQDGGIPGLYSISLRAGDTNGSLVWSGVPNTFPRITWVGTRGSAEFMFIDPPYTAWAEIGERVLDSAGGGSSGGLHVGGNATIFTTDGDRLRLRSGPGMSFLVTRQVDTGTVVTLIDGPVSADGFVWWHIRLPDGTTGWVVDFADGEQTLIPADGGTPAVSATATLGADPSIASQLRVGDAALVTTGSLRLRNVAGIGGGVLREMGRNTYLRVIGGPTRLDNLDWWQVRMLDNTVGWAAEIVGSERVLTYTTMSPPTPTPVLADPPIAPTMTPVFAEPTPALIDTPIFIPPTLIFIPSTLVFVPLASPTPLILIIPTPGVPVQTSPADGAVLDVAPPRTTTLSWNASANASTYEVQRQWCDGAGNNCVDYALISTGNTSYVFDFIGAQVGRWRVRAVSSGGFKSDWSPWRTFRHQR